MAMLIISDDGRVYRVTLGESRKVVELRSTEAGEERPSAPIEASKVEGTVAAVQRLVDGGTHLAEVSTAKVIMGTFVNLPLFGDGKKTKE